MRWERVVALAAVVACGASGAQAQSGPPVVPPQVVVVQPAPVVTAPPVVMVAPSAPPAPQGGWTWIEGHWAA